MIATEPSVQRAEPRSDHRHDYQSAVTTKKTPIDFLMKYCHWPTRAGRQKSESEFEAEKLRSEGVAHEISSVCLGTCKRKTRLCHGCGAPCCGSLAPFDSVGHGHFCFRSDRDLDLTLADIEALPLNTLVGRANELSDCAHVLNGDGSGWARTIRKAYDEHIENRYLHFLIRHGLVRQMVDEDAKGALMRTINYRFRERYVLGGLLSGGSSFSADRARVHVRITPASVRPRTVAGLAHESLVETSDENLVTKAFHDRRALPERGLAVRNSSGFEGTASFAKQDRNVLEL